MSQFEVLAGDTSDTPRSAYRLMPRGPTAAVVGSLLVVAAVGWLLTVRQAGSMSDMVMGLGQIGGLMSMGVGIVTFLVMWAAMMVAMMAPAVAPVALAQRALHRRRSEGVASTAAFVVGYFVVWSVIGLVPLVAFLWFHDISASAANSRWLPSLAGALLIGAGAYQFTRWKLHCRAACCSPARAAADHDQGKGPVASLRAGLGHGVRCLGCCWALMVVLLVVGLMNLVWMVLLSLVFVVEKHWRAPAISRVVGVALLIVGLAVVVRPSLMHTVSGVGDKPPPMTMPM